MQESRHRPFIQSSDHNYHLARIRGKTFELHLH
jgi:hypothetical protein